jgi:hypothetical protein
MFLRGPGPENYFLFGIANGTVFFSAGMYATAMGQSAPDEIQPQPCAVTGPHSRNGIEH